MTLSEARTFIAECDIDMSPEKYWADLGCGEGLFTQALAGRLSEKSRILAIDKSDRFKHKPGNTGVVINFLRGDFLKDLVSENLDGILMANSLHYVKDKVDFVKRNPVAEWIIIEYETRRSNPWVPYPIGFAELQELFVEYSSVIKVSERDSVYQSGKMYCAVIKK